MLDLRGSVIALSYIVAAILFIFGLKTPEVQALKASGYHPMRHYENNPALKAVLDAISGGLFSPDERDRYRPLIDSLLWGGDHYLLLADYDAYVQTQQRVDTLFGHREAWIARAIANVAGMGVFSSDRTIREYARDIWNIDPELKAGTALRSVA